MLAFNLSRRRILRLVLILAAVNLIMLWTTYLARTFWLTVEWWPAQFIGLQFDLSRENNPAVWYASMLLFAVALAMTGCFALENRDRQWHWDRLLSFGWLAGAAVFAALSLDEAGSLHERINHFAYASHLPATLRVRSPGWVGILAIPIVIVGVLILMFAWFRVRQNTAAFLLMAGGTMLFLSVPLQEHFEVQQMLAKPGARDTRSAGWLILEEGTELFGTLCFLAAALWYGLKRAHQLGYHSASRPAAFTASADFAVAIVASLAATMLLVGLAFPQLAGLSAGGRGIPLNWFPSTLAFLLGMASLALAHRYRLAGARVGGAFLVLGLMHVALSIDHGSAHQFTERVLSTVPSRRMMLDVAFTISLVLSCIWVVLAATGLQVKAAAILWAALLMPLWVEASLRPTLGFVAYAMMLLAIVSQALAEQEGGTWYAPAGSGLRAEAS